MSVNLKKVFFNTVFWGLMLWFFGYVLGLIFFAIVPQEQIGFYVLPFGVIATLWVLTKKIVREQLGCYFGLGLIWLLIAVVLDYLFIIKLFNSSAYYKADVYLYYFLIFALPLAVGCYRFCGKKTR